MYKFCLTLCKEKKNAFQYLLKGSIPTMIRSGEEM